MTVDVERFSDECRTNSDRLEVMEALPEVVRTALVEAGIPWDECVCQPNGDALFITVPATVPKELLVVAVPTSLSRGIRTHNASRNPHAHMRLRMALDSGEGETGESIWSSRAGIHATRLRDADVVKDALAGSRGVLAVVTSDWFYQQVVRQSRAIDPRVYRQIRVRAKETTAIAWLCLPDDHHGESGEQAGSTTRHSSPAGTAAPRGHSGLVALPRQSKNLRSLAFNADDTLLAVGGDSVEVDREGTVWLWDVTDSANPVATGRPLTVDSPFDVKSVAFHPHETLLAVGGNGGSMCSQVWLWSIAPDGSSSCFEKPITCYTDSLRAALFSPDGQLLAVGTGGGISLWDVRDPGSPCPVAELHAGTNPDDAIGSLAFSPDGTVLAGTGYNGKLWLWDVTEPRAPRALGGETDSIASYVVATAYSPRGTDIAIVGYNLVPAGRIWLWDVANTSRPVHRGRHPKYSGGVISSVAFSPDGGTLVHGGEGGIWLSDVSDPNRPVGSRRLDADRPAGVVSTVVFTHGGNLLASGNHDGDVHLWRLG
ncbi:WD40 repeat domain-containing protein [Amycolatopsis sp. NBRC 101858]|uniref:WD40 repeat domain-containing protein n=1 Tax=Amycolatopsis sp. NBRC 101858 TaxID=3032200 RepID=UPI0025547E76|nr:WD40 repeat domain-containing protein [Amycolatopsis sp. NBRC 101858]